MPLSNVYPLIFLALVVGYLAGLYTAKLFLKREAERLAGEIFKAQQDEEKARLQ